MSTNAQSGCGGGENKYVKEIHLFHISTRRDMRSQWLHANARQRVQSQYWYLTGLSNVNGSMFLFMTAGLRL